MYIHTYVFIYVHIYNVIFFNVRKNNRDGRKGQESYFQSHKKDPPQGLGDETITRSHWFDWLVLFCPTKKKNHKEKLQL